MPLPQRAFDNDNNRRPQTTAIQLSGLDLTGASNLSGRPRQRLTERQRGRKPFYTNDFASKMQ